LLTDITSVLDDKSIGIEYCQKISEKVSRILIPYRYCIWKVWPILAPILKKHIADTVGSNTNTAILTTLAVLLLS